PPELRSVWNTSLSTVTQSRPAANTTPWGLPPTSTVVVSAVFEASILAHGPSPLFATQTAPAPTATPVGALPTAIVVVTDRVAGSMRTTVSSRVFATQTPPAPM